MGMLSQHAPPPPRPRYPPPRPSTLLHTPAQHSTHGARSTYTMSRTEIVDRVEENEIDVPERSFLMGSRFYFYFLSALLILSSPTPFPLSPSLSRWALPHLALSYVNSRSFASPYRKSSRWSRTCWKGQEYVPSLYLS